MVGKMSRIRSWHLPVFQLPMGLVAGPASQAMVCRCGDEPGDRDLCLGNSASGDSKQQPACPYSAGGSAPQQLFPLPLALIMGSEYLGSSSCPRTIKHTEIARHFAYSCTFRMEDSLQRVTQLPQLLPRLQHPQPCVCIKGWVAAGDEQGDTACSCCSITPAKPTRVRRSGMELADGCARGWLHAGQFALASSWGWRSQPGEGSPQGLPALPEAQ